MPRSPFRLVLLALLALGLAAPMAGAASRKGSDSGLPLPRFVSVKAKTANLRVGPGRDYRVDWILVRPGLPVEIVSEFDNWRRVRDAEGTQGWVFGSLLSGRRTAVVSPWARGPEAVPLVLHKAASPEAPPVARLEPGVIGEVMACDGEWCRFRPEGEGMRTGWLRQVELWGVYPDETIDD